MYELFILGELMDKPMHGYLLQFVLGKVIGPIRQMSWGVLYPLIRKLEKEGYIVQSTENHTGPGRPKKIYEITEKGRERFHALMQEVIEYDQDTKDLFDIKLSKFHHIQTNEQLEILYQYQSYLQYLIKHLNENQNLISDNEKIDLTERQSISRVLGHREHVLQADLTWVKASIMNTKGDNSG